MIKRCALSNTTSYITELLIWRNTLTREQFNIYLFECLIFDVNAHKEATHTHIKTMQSLLLSACDGRKINKTKYTQIQMGKL